MPEEKVSNAMGDEEEDVEGLRKKKLRQALDVGVNTSLGMRQGVLSNYRKATRSAASRISINLTNGLPKTSCLAFES